jgi:hypothetical protein
VALSGNSAFQASAARTNRQAARDVRSARAKKAAAKKAAPTRKAPAAKKTTAAKGASGSSAKKAAGKSVAKKAAGATPVGRAASIGYGAGHKIGAKLRTGGGALSRSNPRRALVAEFLVCFIVLGGAAIVAPQGDKSGIPRLMSKGTGLALLFLFLSLLSAGGEKAAKAATGLGALVTAGYLFTSPDAANILKWITSFYGANGGRLAAAGEVGDAGGPAAAGAVDQDVETILGGIVASQSTVAGAGAGAAQAGTNAGLPPANSGGANKQGLQP